MFLTHSLIWGIFFFSLSMYLLLTFCVINYCVSLLSDTNKSTVPKKSSEYQSVSSRCSMPYWLAFTTVLVFWISCWCGPTVVSGFGHVSFSSFERKIFLLAWLLFTLYLVLHLTSSVLSSTAGFDHITVVYNLTYWTPFLFLTTNVLSLSLVIEVLTSLITLLIITSFNSSSINFNWRSSTSKSLTFSCLSSTYLYSLLTFFWTSLISTLVLFFFIILFYSRITTLDWSLLAIITNYVLFSSTLLHISSVSFLWSLILITIFLKCSITPFHLWKLTFFKGMSLMMIFYYIYVFYFLLFMYFIYLLIGLFSDILFFNSLLFLVLVTVSLFTTPFILYETLNLKSFLALSSIINSSIIFLAVLHFNTLSFNYFSI